MVQIGEDGGTEHGIHTTELGPKNVYHPTAARPQKVAMEAAAKMPQSPAPSDTITDSSISSATTRSARSNRQNMRNDLMGGTSRSEAEDTSRSVEWEGVDIGGEYWEEGEAEGDDSPGKAKGACSVLKKFLSMENMDLIMSYFQYLSLAKFLMVQVKNADMTEQQAAALASATEDSNSTGGLPDWAEQFTENFKFADVANIDFEALGDFFPNADFFGAPWRTKFFCTSILLPFLISFITLVLFESLFQVIWLFSLGSSMILVVLGMVSKYQIPTDNMLILAGNAFSPAAIDGIIYCGFGGCFVCCMGKFIFKFVSVWKELRFERETKEFVIDEAMYALQHGLPTNLAKLDGLEARKKSTIMVAGAKVKTLMVIIVMFLLSHILRNNWFFPSQGIMMVVADTCVGIALFCILYFICIASDWGRARMVGFVTQFKALYVMSFFIILGMLYVPVTKQLLLVWHCEDTSCLQGTYMPVPSPTTFNPINAFFPMAKESWEEEGSGEGAEITGGETQFDLALYNSTSDNATAAAPAIDLPLTNSACKTCHFIGGPGPEGTCPKEMVADLCKETTNSYLTADRSLSCHDLALPFYGPASVLMLLSFSLGVPLLYFWVVSAHKKLLEERISVRDNKNKAANWLFRVRYTTNKAKSLYFIYELHTRYFKLLVLIQKLWLVGTAMFLMDQPGTAAAMMMLIHLVSCLAAVWFKPYIDPIPDQLYIATTFASMLNPLIVLVVVHDLPVDGEVVMWMILAINILLPLLSLFVGYHKNTHEGREMMEEEREISQRFTHEELEEEMPALRKDVDTELNHMTLSILIKMFTFLLVSSMLSATMIFVGQVTDIATAPITPSSSIHSKHPGQVFRDANYDECLIEKKMREFEFVGYHDWTDFVDNCCCMQVEGVGNGTDVSGDGESAIEMWKCRNGRHKERIRKEGNKDGRLVRHFCSSSFSGAPYTASEPQYDSGQFAYYVQLQGADRLWYFW